MIRVVLAVALAAALLGVSLPAVADARADRTAAALDGAALRVDRAARDVAASESAVAPGTPGARRVLRVRLPARSLARAAAEFVALCPAARPGGRGRVVYALDGRAPVVRRLGVPLDGSTGPVVVRDPGDHRVVLEHVRRDGTGVVRATVAGGTPAGGGRGTGSNTGRRPPAPCDSSTASLPTAPATATTNGRAAVGRGSKPRPAPRTVA